MSTILHDKRRLSVAKAKQEFIYDVDLPYHDLVWGMKIFHEFCSIEQIKILLKNADNEFVLCEPAFVNGLQFFNAFLPDMVLSLARANVCILDEDVKSYAALREAYERLLSGEYIIRNGYLSNWKRHLEVLIPEAELYLKALIKEYADDMGDLKVIFPPDKTLTMVLKKVRL